MRGFIVAVAVLATLIGGTPANAARPVDRALITERDLPPGYQQVDSGNDTVASLGIGTGNALRGCPALGMSRRPVRSTSAVFAKGPTGPYVAALALRYAPGGARATMEALDAARRHCNFVIYRSQVGAVRFGITTLPMRPMRARTVPMHLSGRTSGMVSVSVEADLVAVRRGDFVLVSAEFAIGRRLEGIAPRIAPLTLARCARLIRGC
jgi:hypothetical protein